MRGLGVGPGWCGGPLRCSGVSGQLRAALWRLLMAGAPQWVGKALAQRYPPWPPAEVVVVSPHRVVQFDC